MTRPVNEKSVTDALQAVELGFTPIPVRDGGKNPHQAQWTRTTWDDQTTEAISAAFTTFAEEGASNIGLVLGEPGGNLVDVDLDNPEAVRLAPRFLPPTLMKSGRASRPHSHYWYIASGALPGNRRYKMPDGEVSVELRSTGSQTVIPHSFHPSGEQYVWEGEPWGGRGDNKGPRVFDGRTLTVQVALLALASVLLQKWPKEGGRHDAYLALAGGLLRQGDGVVHPFWERNLAVLIDGLADATRDTENRSGEVIPSTISRIRAGERAVGFPRLAEALGSEEHAEMARRLARDLESMAGHTRSSPMVEEPVGSGFDTDYRMLPPEQRDPLSERLSAGDFVDLEPYLLGGIKVARPTVLSRDDGKCLFYEGKLNTLYGHAEGAKSWVGLMACVQEMARGERVVYIDLEDQPQSTTTRMQQIGAGTDDIDLLFKYVSLDEPFAPMQINRFGSDNSTDRGTYNQARLEEMLESANPHLIVVDGMTVLYGMHGLDSNDAASTAIIERWLKNLTRNGRSTVVVIDHTSKSAQRGSAPIGAHHKIAMVQGSAVQCHPRIRPRPGDLGEVELIVYKDRPGGVREVSNQQNVFAVLTMDSREDRDIIRWRFDTPDPDDVGVDLSSEKVHARAEQERRKAETAARQAEIEQLILTTIQSTQPPQGEGTFTVKNVCEEVNAALTADDDRVPMLLVRHVAQKLTAQGQVDVRGVGRGTHYRWVDAGDTGEARS